MIQWNLKNAPENLVGEIRIEHELLRYFNYTHLPIDLQIASEPFHDLAVQLDTILPDDSQKDLAITNLLQAKDAAVRSYLNHLNKKDGSTN